MVDDLDFDDITGKKTVDPLPPPKVEKTTIKVESNYLLAYPISPNKFKAIDLNGCTSEEFANFVNYTYPVAEEDARVFERRDIRVRALKNIIKWHTQSLQFLRSQQREPKDPKPN